MSRFFVLALLLTAFAAPAGAGDVQNVRIWAGPDKTRVVLDLDDQVDYRLFTLDDPHRLVVDIDGARMTGAPELDPEHAGVVQRVRHGIRDGEDLRVVLDLGARARAQSFLLEPTGRYGHRLVLDLFPEGAESASERVRQVARTLPEDDRDMIVAIDAGHGGEDPGAIGPAGTHEKNVVMAIARELARQIDEAPGMSAVMIRTGDYYVPLKERYQRARDARADLFVSIHADAFRDFRVRGSSVYVLSRRGASSEAARLLAQSENAADRAGGVSLEQSDDMLRSVLLDLSQNASMEYSNAAAQTILDELGRVGKTHRRQVERANFVVLRSHDVPSVLIETGFISNPDDEKNLGSPRYRARIASAILGGIEDHFRQTAPRGTWFAANRDNGAEYVVRRGDTLGTIAQRYSVSLAQLRRANRLDSDMIHPGAVLVIPSS
ncbi:AMIN domain-containing protein [Wenzhouxiangella sp. XN79A]|uniref:N-acetylmuramoyl-L-alanine amidase n=1 Tax=Wenzhouxiangella sp. XN79A TaxID=2724193 RepID=UPI00144AF10E|nr:N-acetylmuramoyl-L-alanine amidase [Wenzhouxiangella sp. XN79A]NKI34296.1 AMIN domain-containing protein [Wenzhouxiangella sp. XN79A]